MSLQDSINQAVKLLESGSLRLEAHARKYVIDPILGELGWDNLDPTQVMVEYEVDNRLVDYALLDKGKPLVFVEAKKVGHLSPDAEEQVFGYAVNRGIPLLVLTDGNQWDFYLAMAAGEITARRFWRIELSTLDNARLPEYEKSFRAFLGKQEVTSGRARRDAETYHEDNQVKERAKAELEGAWQGLLSPPNEILVDLLTEEVEGICGTRPRQKDVESFIKGLAGSFVEQVPRRQGASSGYSQPRASNDTSVAASGRSAANRSQSVQKPRAIPRKIAGYRLHGNEFACRGAAATLVEVVKALQAQDNGFLDRLYADFRNRTRTRVFVSKQRNELFQITLPDNQ